MSTHHHFEPGSFNRYQKDSGSFVTALAVAITRADRENLEKVKQVYPQMVAAYQHPNWAQAPDGFTPCYNGKEV